MSERRDQASYHLMDGGNVGTVLVDCDYPRSGAAGFCTRVALLLMLPLILGSKADEWASVAEQNARFAVVLARDGVRFDSRYLGNIIEGRVVSGGCRPRPSKLDGLDPITRKQILLYADEYCEPWFRVLSESLESCDRGVFVPKWCESGNEALGVEHIRIGSYFETMIAALQRESAHRERYNIMSVITERLAHKILRDSPQIEGWAVRGATILLDSAEPDEALGVGWSLLIVPVRKSTALGEAYRNYAIGYPRLSDEDRRLAEEIARAFEGAILPVGVRDELHERYGRLPKASPATPTPDRTAASEVRLLVERLRTYYRLIGEKRFAESWGMLATESRETSSEEEYVRTWAYLERKHSASDLRVVRIRVKGDSALVNIERRGKKDVWEEGSFWVFERGTWYVMMPIPPFWEDSGPVEVP